MSLVVNSKGEGSKFPPISEGAQRAVCYAVVDIGEQKVVFEKNERSVDQVVVIWELPDEVVETDDGPIVRTISKTYTKSLHEKSALYKDLRSWRGKEFTKEELDAFDLKNIIGAPCLLNIVHKTKGDNVYANIASIMSLPKGMERPKLTRDPLVFDMDEATEEDVSKLPEWLQRKVKDSLTWKERMLERDAGGGSFKGPQFESGDDFDDENLPF
jgi:hypothetical protein